MSVPHDSRDTRPVRASEQLDWDALALYVRPKLAEACGDEFEVAAPLEVEQFAGGHSNLTYLLRFGEQEFVMRRPPFGPVPPRAHDMARECRVLFALHPVFPLAPRPYLLCEDDSVIGSTFYLMERRRGLVVRGEEPTQLSSSPEARRRASAALVDTLAALHLVDVAHNERLLALGKPTGFVERQVRGWTERWHGSQTSELAEMDALAAWLAERLPPDATRPALVHGDYKLDNVMFDAGSAARVVAVFDWEMSAVGDPLIDVGIMLAYWVHTTALTRQAEASSSIASVTDRAGWFTRAEILARYAARTGFDLSNITFYEVFAVFKIAVVLQQIFYRYQRGQTDDPRFAPLGQHVAMLARIASELAGRA
jgi:aminoglycoside phosphotransferase (APT) family kinase protein